MIYHPILDATVIDCNPGHVKILIEIALEGRDMWMAGRKMLCREVSGGTRIFTDNSYVFIWAGLG